jgi:hypothetical protein
MTKTQDSRILPYTITEAELAKRTGMRPVEWKIAALRLEALGFPRIHPIIGARLRLMVDRWFEAEAGYISPPPSRCDGKENWEMLRGNARRPDQPK